MKHLLYMSLMILLLTGCAKNGDPIEYEVVDGLYEGYFAYQGTSYWHVIELDSNRYLEWISGGLYYQKHLWCYTAGTYSTDSEKLIFELDSFLHNIDPAYYICNPDWLMPGEYNIDYLDNDSLVFKRGEGDGKIIYHYRRCPVREMPCP